MKAVGYSVDEALNSLRRAGRSAAMSIGTIAVAFMTLGGFFLVSANLQSVVERWAAAAEMSVYLDGDVDEAARQALLDDLSAHEAVAAVEFVSSAQALERFTTDFPELGDLAASDENPFPASLEVRLHTDAAAAAEAIAAEVSDRPGVADVRYDRRWLARLVGMTTTVRAAGLAIAAVLVLGAAFTVVAVVRLSLIARRDELEIMELVGAPLGFIRGPFVAEGTLLGGIGAALALVLLYAVFAALRTRVQEVAAGFASVGDVRFLAVPEALLLVAAGVVVGALAGVVASRSARAADVRVPS